MNAKRYTSEKWFEKGQGLKVRLNVIYLLVDCYFKSRGNAAMFNKHSQKTLEVAKRKGLVSVDKISRMKITPAGKQYLRDHRLTKIEHADLRSEYSWLEGAA
jgi:hypothetical protein